MLNIGRLRAESAEYYLAAVAPTAAYYSAGQGEAAGRWAGSLAAELGLAGEVDPAVFRQLLAGRHPGTGEFFYTAQGSNARAQARHRNDTDQPSKGEAGDRRLDAMRVAVQAKVSVRAVRYWMTAGQQLAERLAELTPGLDVNDPDALTARLEQLVNDGVVARPLSPFLFTQPATARLGGRRTVRQTTPAELDRFLARRADPAAARAGFDLVIRPPKSYSLLWAIGPPRAREGIAAAHRQAVDDALRYLEDVAALTRTTLHPRRGRQAAGARVRTAGDGFIVAAFDHRDSRAGDPLLHTHCVIANVTRTTRPRRGRRPATITYGALDSAALYRHARTADVIYNATFRQLCRTQLGIEHQPVRNGWADIKGFPRHVIDGMSKRSAEIAQELERAGMGDSHRAREAAALASRQPKNAEQTTDGDLHRRWVDEAERAWDFTPAQAARHLDTVRTQQHQREPDQLAELTEAFDRLAAPEGLLAATATFTQAETIAALAGRLPHLTGPQLVAAAHTFLASDRVVALEEHRSGKPRARILDGNHFRAHLPDVRYTTPQLLAIETDVLTARWSAPHPTPAHVAAVLDASPTLDTAQRTAIEQLCGPGDGVRTLVGFPGAGKTYVARSIAAAYQHAGMPVVGCAVTATAADELARQAAIPADTVARTLADIDRHGLQPASLVILDEASTINHWDLHRLHTHTRAAGGTLLLVGDPHQHAAVGPGHLFAALCERDPGQVTLDGHHRLAGEHLSEERHANAEYRSGDIGAALERRDRDGKIIRAATLAQLHRTITAHWAADHDRGGRTPMLAPTNAARRQLNQLARQHLQDTGRLHGPTLHLQSEDGAVTLQAGDWIIARHNDRQLRDPAAPGWWLRNGTRGVITRVDTHTGQIAADFNGHHLTIPRRYLTAGHIEHAYALTDYLIQGRTVTDPARALLDHTSSRPGAYVAATRSTAANLTYLVDGTTAPPLLDPDQHTHQHTTDPGRRSGLDEAAAHLLAAEPAATIHDIDPGAAAAHQHAGRSLAELHHAQGELRQQIGPIPADLSTRLAATTRHHDEQTARQRLLGRSAAPPTGLARLRNALTRHQAARDERLAELAPLLQRQADIEAATNKRELRLRHTAAAQTPPTTGGPVDPLRRRRQQRDAAERALLEQDRGGELP